MEKLTKIELNLTDDELEALDNYAFKKMCYLEDDNLMETVCYGLFTKIHRTIRRNEVNKKTDDKIKK